MKLIWSFPSFLLALVGVFSTLLNVVQIFNGVSCFDRVSNSNAISGEFSSIEVHFGGIGVINSTQFCSERDEEGFSLDFFTVKSGGYFSAKVKFDCDKSVTTKNVLNLNPSHAFILPTGSSSEGRHAIVYYDSGVCLLQSRSYRIFAAFCISLTLILACLKVVLNTVLLTRIDGFYYKPRLNWVFSILDRLEMFHFCNPNINCPQPINSSDVLYEFSFADKCEDFDVSPFSYNQSGACYSFDYVDGLLSLRSSDRMGVFYINDQVNLSAASEIRECLKLKSESVPIIEGNHHLNVKECCGEIMSGKKLFLSNKKPKMLYGTKFGQVLSDKELFNNLKKHMTKFFGFYSENVLKGALSGHPKCPGFDVKNSEWKMYLSDLYFHFKLKLESKSKKFQPSRSFLDFNDVEIRRSLIAELSIMSAVEENKNLLRDSADTEDKPKQAGVTRHFSINDTEEEDRMKLAVIAKTNQFSSNKFRECLREPWRITVESSLLATERVVNHIVKGDAMIGEFGYCNGGINSLVWIKHNYPLQAKWGNLYKWHFGRPKVQIVSDVATRKTQVDSYLHELNELEGEVRSLLRSPPVCRSDQLIKERESLENSISRNQNFLDKEVKKGQIAKYERLIAESKLKLDKIKTESIEKLDVNSIYEDIFTRAKKLSENEVHRSCVSFCLGESKDCMVSYSEFRNEEKRIPLKDHNKYMKKMRGLINKQTKGFFSQLAPSIESSMSKMMLSGCKPSLNRFKFSHSGREFYLWPAIKQNLKADYKKAVNKSNAGKDQKSGESVSQVELQGILLKVQLIESIVLINEIESGDKGFFKHMQTDFCNGPQIDLALRFKKNHLSN